MNSFTVLFEDEKLDLDLKSIVDLLKGEKFKSLFDPYLHLENNQGTKTCFLDVFYNKQYGYHLYGIGKEDSDYYVMIEEKEEDFILGILLGGAEIKCCYHNFVSEEKMIQAVEFFYAEYRLNPDLSWAKESDEYMDDIYY
jgi:hypothetical protein